MFTTDMWNNLDGEVKNMKLAMSLVSGGVLSPENATKLNNETLTELQANIKEVEKFAESKGVTVRVEYNDYDLNKLVNAKIGLYLYDLWKGSRFHRDSNPITNHELRRSLYKLATYSGPLAKAMSLATKGGMVKVSDRDFRYGLDPECIVEKYANGSIKVDASKHMGMLKGIANYAEAYLQFIDRSFPIKR